MLDVVLWYIAASLFGISGFAPGFALFRHAPSRGVFYARPLGLLLVSIVVWSIASWTPLPYATALAAAAVAAGATASAVLLAAWPALRTALRRQWRPLALSEAIHLAVFCGVLAIRLQIPDARIIEKPMELMLLTVTNNTQAMPPVDAWFSGHGVSYYYFGFVMVDLVGRLATVPPAYGLSLGFASVIAMGVVATIGLVSDIVHRMAGLSRRARNTGVALAVAAVWLAVPPVAVLHFIERLTSGPHAFAGIWWSDWWGAAVDQGLPYATLQYPSFIVILGDLHPHVIGMPLLMIALAIVADEVLNDDASSRGIRKWTLDPAAFVLTALVFAGVAMTNAWDAVTCGALWLILGTARGYATAGAGPPARIATAIRIVPVALLAMVVASPMLAAFDAPAPKVTVTVLPMSLLPDLVGMWGALLLPAALAWALLRPAVPRRALRVALQMAAVMLVTVLVVVPLGGGHVETYGLWGISVVTPIVLAPLAAVLGAAAMGALQRARGPDTIWICALAASVAILLCVEVFVVVGGPGLGRFNTVFKFGLVAWVLMALAGPIALTRAAAMRDSWAGRTMPDRVVVAAVAGSVAVSSLLGLLYIPAALHTRMSEGHTSGLDSLAYLRDVDPGAYASVEWVRAHLDADRHVLIEAVSPSFGYGNVIASSTGIPTLLGWPNHERHWRGRIPLIAERRSVTGDIYLLGGAEAAHRARAYGVTHVYVGVREQATYGAHVVDRFDGWPIVFEDAGVFIFAVPYDDATTTPSSPRCFATEHRDRPGAYRGATASSSPIGQLPVAECGSSE